MSSRTRRSSTRPAPVQNASAAESTAAAPAASSSASSASSSAPQSRKLKKLHATYSAFLDTTLAPSTTPSALLASLPKELHTRHALTIQRQCEKVLTAIHKNCMNEFEVILNEHALPQKLSEIEWIESIGGMDTRDGHLLNGLTPTPEQSIRNMLDSARESERIRLLELAESLEAENALLREEMLEISEAMKRAKSAVQKKIQRTDQIYDALEKESRQVSTGAQ